MNALERALKRAGVSIEEIEKEKDIILKIEKCQKRISRISARLLYASSRFSNLINQPHSTAAKKYAQLQRRKEKLHKLLNYLISLDKLGQLSL